jgi:hypothetical protein
MNGSMVSRIQIEYTYRRELIIMDMGTDEQHFIRYMANGWLGRNDYVCCTADVLFLKSKRRSKN